MATNLLPASTLVERAAGLGAVSRGMLRERAMELAVTNGRSFQETSKSDWEQAKRELAAQPDLDPETAVLASRIQC